MPKTDIGILLVNLGTPDSPHPKDVHKYLVEFLTDERVIDIPWLQRQFLVRGLIIPSRYKQSAQAYQKIWSTEGSPLMVYGRRVQKSLQDKLGQKFHVELAMRYQNPSLNKGLNNILEKNPRHLIILPLFPQYASASTGSVYQKVMELLRKKQSFPKITFISDFSDHPALINAFCHVARKHPINEYDHYLFSFHGLPQRQLKKSDQFNHCLKTKNCCQNACQQNINCYAAQCHQTYNALVNHLQLQKEKTTLAFQSRLGKEPWIEPFTPVILKELAKQNKKKVLVFCPSFVCDCLETIYEIGIEYSAEFQAHGGEKLDLVQGLNDEPLWIDALKTLILENLPNHCTKAPNPL